MDSPFIYDKYVTGKNFIGRKADYTIMGNLFEQGENVAIYDCPKSGKMSLIQQTLFRMRVTGKQFLAGQFSALNIRSNSEFLLRLGATAIRTIASTPAEYQRIISQYLGGTHFVFDQEAFSTNDEIISRNWDIDDNDIKMMLSLPQKLAREKNLQMYMIIDEFQSLNFTEDGDKLFRAFGAMLKDIKEEPKPGACFIMCGSMVNAMKDLFEVKTYFYKSVERFQMQPIDEKEIIEHIVKGFLTNGKVIDRDLLLGVCKLFRNNIWYINTFISICDGLSKGYITQAILNDALECIISIHEPRFRDRMNDLTTHQVDLLRAIIEGHKKFSGSEVVTQYQLNSSANVKRVKDALMKKEIITFDDNDEPIIMDPLFEFWIRRDYFGKKTEL